MGASLQVHKGLVVKKKIKGWTDREERVPTGRLVFT